MPQQQRGQVSAERKELERLLARVQRESVGVMEELGNTLIELRGSVKDEKTRWEAERAPLMSVLEKVAGRNGDVIVKLVKQLSEEREQHAAETERRAQEKAALEGRIERQQQEYDSQSKELRSGVEEVRAAQNRRMAPEEHPTRAAARLGYT